MTDVKISMPPMNSSGKYREATMEDDFAFSNNVAGASKLIRLGFLRKVYGILSAQLILTCIIAGAIVMVEDIHLYLLRSPNIIMLSMFGSLGSLIGLLFMRTRVPANYILLSAFVSPKILLLDPFSTGFCNS